MSIFRTVSQVIQAPFMAACDGGDLLITACEELIQNPSQACLKGISNFAEWKKDPEFLLKIAQIAIAIFKLMSFYLPGESLIKVINQVNLHDVVSLLRDPKNYFYPTLHASFSSPTVVLMRINSCMWTAVNVMSFVSYLHSWDLIDTAKWAASIGQYPLLEGIKYLTLDKVIVGLVVATFLVKFITACCKRYDLGPSILNEPDRQTREGWDMLTSIFDIALNAGVFTDLIGYTKIGNTYIQLLTILTKGIGNLGIISKMQN